MKKFFLFFLSFILSFTILFLITEKYPLQKQNILENEKIEYQYKPYLLWRARPNQKLPSVAINSDGHRGNEFKKEKDADTFRIIIIGGSAAWGYGSSSNKNSLSYKIEKYISDLKLNKKTEVYNFSENGYSSSQELILWREIINYNPDLVIQYTGYNDAYTGFLKLDPGWNHPFIKENILIKDNFKIIKELAQIEVKKIIDKSKLIASINFISNFVQEKIDQEHSYNTKSYTDIDDISQLFIENISLSSQIAAANDIELIVVIQPTLFDTQKELKIEEENIVKNFENDFPNSINYFNNVYKLMKEKLKKNEIKFYDGSDLLNKTNENIYIDLVHNNDLGQDVIASKIFEIIKNIYDKEDSQEKIFNN
jgi:lysophospholipase L1-like esterase